MRLYAERDLPGPAVVGLGEGIQGFLRPTETVSRLAGVPKLNLLFGGNT